MRRLIALAVVFFFLFGCSSSTLVESNPPGAKFYLDGQLKGKCLIPIPIEQQEAPTRLLAEKGIFTRVEFLEGVKVVK